jgi:hypothetical protein
MQTNQKMKNYIFTFFSLLLALGSSAQSLYPQVVEYPKTGFEYLKNNNPYILEQEMDSNGNWENVRKYSWAPAPVSGYNLFTATHVWNNNEWAAQDMTTDSFVMNTDGTIFKVFEIVEYNYPGFTSKEKYKYTFTYDNDKRINTFRIDKTPNASSNTYQAYFLSKLFYDNSGRRSFDSSIYYQQSYNYITRYDYDNDNHVVAMYNITIPENDTVYRLFYSYHNNSVKTIYGENWDNTAQAWAPQSIDSITFTNDNPTRRKMYGYVSFNGSDLTFQPTSDYAFTYNSDGTLSTIEQKTYWNGDWSNYMKQEFLYSNGKPTLGYRYYTDASGAFENSASGRYLFTFLSGVNNAAGNNQISNLYPNPANDHLQFTLNNFTGKDATYFIYDCTGKLVLTDHVYQQNMNVNLDGLSNGVYFLNILSNNTISSRKFMISR